MLYYNCQGRGIASQGKLLFYPDSTLNFIDTAQQGGEIEAIMYKITGNFHGEKINDVYDTPTYALGVYMAYIEKWMPSKFSAEAVSAGRDVLNNNFPHQLKFSDDVWVKINIDYNC